MSVKYVPPSINQQLLRTQLLRRQYLYLCTHLRSVKAQLRLYDGSIKAQLRLYQGSIKALIHLPVVVTTRGQERSLNTALIAP